MVAPILQVNLRVLLKSEVCAIKAVGLSATTVVATAQVLNLTMEQVFIHRKMIMHASMKLGTIELKERDGYESDYGICSQGQQRR